MQTTMLMPVVLLDVLPAALDLLVVHAASHANIIVFVVGKTVAPMVTNTLFVDGEIALAVQMVHRGEDAAGEIMVAVNAGTVDERVVGETAMDQRHENVVLAAQNADIAAQSQLAAQQPAILNMKLVTNHQ